MQKLGDRHSETELLRSTSPERHKKKQKDLSPLQPLLLSSVSKVFWTPKPRWHITDWTSSRGCHLRPRSLVILEHLSASIPIRILNPPNLPNLTSFSNFPQTKVFSPYYSTCSALFGFLFPLTKLSPLVFSHPGKLPSGPPGCWQPPRSWSLHHIHQKICYQTHDLSKPNSQSFWLHEVLPAIYSSSSGPICSSHSGLFVFIFALTVPSEILP